MDTKNMTPQQLRELADKLESAQEKVIKVGYLKEDLYDFKPKHGIDTFWLVTTTRKAQLIENYTKGFKLVVAKGAKFECIRFTNGEELWFDTNGHDIDSMDHKWAIDYLENIHEVNS